VIAAVLFYSLLFVALFLAPALVIFVFLLFIDHERRLWRAFGPVITPVAKAWWERPAIRKLRDRYPRTLTFVARRLNPRDPWGLPATLATITVIVGISWLLGIVQDIVGKDPLVTVDVRLHNSMPLFRSPGVTRLILAITEFGSPAVSWAIAFAFAFFALARGLRRLAMTYVLAVAGSGILSVALKAAFGYARPPDALIATHEASFPSGHLLADGVLYGLLASLVLQSQARPVKRAVATMFLLLVIAAVGVSRLYLGVHWPSDLLASLAVALICLALVLFFLHYELPIPRVDNFTVPLSATAMRRFGVVLIVIGAVAGALLMQRVKFVSATRPVPRRPLPETALLGGLPADIPRRAEGLIGERMEPISLVLIGSDEDVIATFARAGWQKADLPTPIRVVREGLAAIENQPDSTGPATPAYLADRPQSSRLKNPMRPHRESGTATIREYGRRRTAQLLTAGRFRLPPRVTTSGLSSQRNFTCPRTASTRTLIMSAR
jgi:undecaprenyl-diphosphatase